VKLIQMMLRKIIIIGFSLAAFVSSFFLINWGVNKRKDNEPRFSFGQFMFKTRGVQSSSGNQLIGEGVIAFILGLILLFFL
jgi:hypothetical protein